MGRTLPELLAPSFARTLARMTASRVVMISAPQRLAGLKARTGNPENVLTFTDTDALAALAVITQHKPSLVVLDRLFAVTPRGAALVHRIRTDPALVTSEIRILAHDGEYARVIRPRAVKHENAETVDAETSPGRGLRGDAAGRAVQDTAGGGSTDRGDPGHLGRPVTPGRPGDLVEGVATVAPSQRSRRMGQV